MNNLEKWIKELNEKSEDVDLSCMQCPAQESCEKSKFENCADCFLEWAMTEEKKEQVNHPSHYNKGGTECIDCMVGLFGLKNTCIFCLINAYKYIFRAGNKEGNSYEQDLKKAEWYIEWVGNKKVEDTELLEKHKKMCELFYEVRDAMD